MFKWLKNLFSVKPEPEPPVSELLECVIHLSGDETERVTVHVRGANGVYLYGDVVGRGGQASVADRQAADPEQFWKLWKKHMSDLEFTWETLEHDKELS